MSRGLGREPDVSADRGPVTGRSGSELSNGAAETSERARFGGLASKIAEFGTAEGADGWAVIIPVKPAAVGKSRLDVPGVDRVTLARAIALDTIAAVAACDAVAQVFVVTEDGGLVSMAFDIPDLRFVPERDVPDRPRGIDTAVWLGADAATERMPRAALLGDLPALRPGDLAAALAGASGVPRGVVADAEGTGTTLVTAGAGITLLTSFGNDSYARHLALGCEPLAVESTSTLRRDVDTAQHLERAAALRLGPRTTAVLGRNQSSR